MRMGWNKTKEASLDVLVPWVWFWVSRDKRGRELKGHQHLAVRNTFSHGICTTDLYDGNLCPHVAGKPATRFTTKFKWKVLVILWNFLPRCSETSWLCQARATSSYKVLQRNRFCPLVLHMPYISPSMCHRLVMYLFIEWMYGVSEWMKAELN